MERNLSEQVNHDLVVSDSKTVGKRNSDWDLKDWKWDGELLTATPLNSGPSRSLQSFPGRPEDSEIRNNSSRISSLCLDKTHEANGNRGKELEKRRAVADDSRGFDKESDSIHFSLGEQVYPIVYEDAKSGKKAKIIDAEIPSNPALCQVVDCKADLGGAKDYHRRHKVCEMHSRASEALVGNVMQRFCQQCSRFHGLQEFDEGKRSCRRRLAGHNKRRRKTHPDNLGSPGSLPSERSNSYLLTTLLRILTNIHTINADPAKDQDLLSDFLKNLGSLAGPSDARSIPGLLQGSQVLLNDQISSRNIEEAANLASNASAPATTPGPLPSGSNCYDLSRLMDHSGSVLASNAPSAIQFLSRGNLTGNTTQGEAIVQEIKGNNFDLNDVFIDSPDFKENVGNSQMPVPSQTIGNTVSTSSQSPYCSSGQDKNCTDRIVFKLFGKDPSEIPVVLRTQILEWLSHSPTDIEGYIRPGCIVLTIYIRLRRSTWDELCFDLGSKLRKLLDASNNSFWKTGWVYTRVQHRAAFVCYGEVVLDTSLSSDGSTSSLSLENPKYCTISSIRPIALCLSERAQITVKGYNLYQPNTKLLCALEGEYLAQETPYNLLNSRDSSGAQHELQIFRFSCSMPNIFGRGFIEVEDHGLSSSFFPFIVAEKEMCSEIRMLESVIEATETANDIWKQTEENEAKNRALDFIHEMGWLLRRCKLDYKSNLFPFTRFKRLIEFSLDHNWCAVANALLDVLFGGKIDLGQHGSVRVALSDLGVLHRAVKRNDQSMVELLLRYVPRKVVDEERSKQWRQESGISNEYIFKPDDISGPDRITPLHITASISGSECVLDALTDDPGQVGVGAWMNACDSSGLTPEDYARIRGFKSYIHLVQRKINKSKSESQNVVVDIISNTTLNPKPPKVSSFHTEMTRRQCKVCANHKQGRLGAMRKQLFVCRPAMLSMVAIAAVCVCVALLFKSSPEVLYVFQPFRWELLKYGSR